MDEHFRKHPTGWTFKKVNKNAHFDLRLGTRTCNYRCRADAKGDVWIKVKGLYVKSKRCGPTGTSDEEG